MRIAIDVIPIRITGEVGGAMHLVLELIQGLALQNAENQYFLLTAGWNHQYFEKYEQYGIQRILVAGEDKPNIVNNNIFARIKRKLLMTKLGTYLRKVKGFTKSSILKSNGIDLLFCPMTAVTYAEPGIPTVSIIYDLQHEYYPQFFSSHELEHRRKVFKDLVEVADVLICISEYTKRTVVEKYNYDPERIFAIHISVQERLEHPDKNELKVWLSQKGLLLGGYIFYPANFWPHKNHRMLLTAFNMYIKKHQERNLKLVFTGSLIGDYQDIKDAIKIMGLDDQILILGYVSDQEIGYLMAGCKYIIFPSLYEGFGIPVVEAMAFAKPVLCSNTTSLPEVGGEAPLYFDPRKPDEIVACMEQISDTKLAEHKIAIALEQVRQFTFQKMVERYSEVLNLASSCDGKLDYKCEGIYADGWSSESIQIIFGPSKTDRTIQLAVTNSKVSPIQVVKAYVYLNKQLVRSKELPKESVNILIQDIGQESGIVEVTFSGTFVPKTIGINDERVLGVQVTNVNVVNTQSLIEIKKII